MVSINNEVRLSHAPEVVKFMEWIQDNPGFILEDEETLARLRATAKLSLSEAEIKEITGYSMPIRQLKMLESLGVPARRRPDNSVLVLRMHLMQPAAIAAVAAKNGPQLKSSKSMRI